MKLICDNQDALHIASNSVFHNKNQAHKRLICHFVREKVLMDEITTSFVDSNDQLPKGLWDEFICNKFGTYDICSNAKGSVGIKHV